MIYPNVWGRGAIVGYSGLEGTVTFNENMWGQLMAERLGISLDDGDASLYFHLRGIIWLKEFTFNVVCSDLIEGTFTDDTEFKYVFVNQNTVAGHVDEISAVPVFHVDLVKEEKNFEGGKAYLSERGWYAFATKKEGTRIQFAVCRHADVDEAIKGANEALTADLDAYAKKYKEFFAVVPELKKATEEEKLTFAKCFSVMKSQVMSKEGVFTTHWTTPERTPHRKCWLWDSVFHSMGNIFISEELAYETLTAILDMQFEDGFVPHMRFPDGRASNITQPPLIAWGLYTLYERTGRLDWVEKLYDKVAAHLSWVRKNRDKDNNNLYEWYARLDDPTCHCGESGMDNTPRFDEMHILDCIDFSCYMANEMRHMEKMAKLLGRDDEAKEYAELYEIIGKQINDRLFDEETGRYYDRDIYSGEVLKMATPAGLLPLFAGVCPPDRAKILIDDIMNPETYGTEMPIPTVSMDDPEHCIDYWRGMVWINYVYMVQQGMRKCGYVKEANEIADRAIKCVAEWYMKDGSIFEIYDPLNKLSPWDLERKGKVLKPEDYYARLAPVRDFGWSSTLYVAMVMERENRE